MPFRSNPVQKYTQRIANPVQRYTRIRGNMQILQWMCAGQNNDTDNNYFHDNIHNYNDNNYFHDNIHYNVNNINLYYIME